MTAAEGARPDEEIGPEVGWELPSPEAAEPPAETIHWVEQQLGTSVAGVTALPGGISSAVCRLQLAAPVTEADGRDRVVLRRHTNTAWMAREPYIPHDEARILTALGSLDVGVTTPTLIAADPDGERCDVPTILMTEIDGRPIIEPADPVPWAEQLAERLAAIHQAPIPEGLPAFRRWDRTDTPVPTWIEDSQRWTAAKRHAAAPLPTGEPKFLHRDYHPNNIHWHHDRICGVVDWLSACIGPVEVDLSHCRWNLAILNGPDLAEHFTIHYNRSANRGPESGHDPTLLAYDLSTIMSAPVGPFPTHAWNALGRHDLTSGLVAGRIETWLARVLSNL